MTAASDHRVVIVGGGFAGLNAARALRRAAVKITLIDRRNFHLFQPLLYQVATGGLSPANIAAPLRTLFKRRGNVEVLLGEVTGIDAGRKIIRVAPPPDAPASSGENEIAYDTLVLAAGS